MNRRRRGLTWAIGCSTPPDHQDGFSAVRKPRARKIWVVIASTATWPIYKDGLSRQGGLVPLSNFIQARKRYGPEPIDLIKFSKWLMV